MPVNPHIKPKSFRLSAGVVTLIYAIAGFSWIVFSDLLLEGLAWAGTYVSIIKGCLFIFLTSLLIYYLLRLYGGRIQAHFQALQQAESQYRFLFENNPIPMWVYDLSDYKFLFVNQAAIKKYGYSKEEFMAMTIFDIRPEEDHEKLRENISSDPNNDFIFSGIWRHRKKSGELVYVEIDSHPLQFEGKQCKLVLATDVTNFIVTQREMKAVADELNNFVYRASHDLRGPLARVIGLSNLLMMENRNAGSEYLNILHKTACLMDKMLARLLAVNRIKEYTPELQHINLRQAVDKAMESVREANGITVAYKNEVNDDFIISADPTIVLTVLENLLDNAVKYRHPQIDPNIRISASVNNGEVHIYIADNGIGIDESVKPYIFNLFFRGTELSQGSGLGLYIAREAIKRQKGKIELKRSAINETVFEVLMPLDKN